MGIESSDAFLKESWRRKAAQETAGDSEENPAARIYARLRKETENQPEMEKLFDQVQSDIVRYKKAIETQIAARAGERSPQEIENINQSQRRVHNRLVDDLNLLSRQFKSRGLDNEWRREIGLDNERVKNWAEKVAENLENQQTTH